MGDVLKKIKLSRLDKNEQIFLNFLENSYKQRIDNCIYYVSKNDELCEIRIITNINYVSLNLYGGFLFLFNTTEYNTSYYFFTYIAKLLNKYEGYVITDFC